MSESLQDFKARTRSARGRREAARRPQFEMLAQAAVKTADLTGDDRWDWFLSLLQAAVEHTEAQRDAFAEVIQDLKTADYEAIMAAKTGLAECKGRINAWNATISLPKDLIEMGREAKTILDRLDAP